MARKAPSKARPSGAFIYFDPATGEIAQVATIPVSEAALNCAPGQAYVPAPPDVAIDPGAMRVGPDGDLVAFTPPVDEARLLPEIRAERNRRLASCDWTQAPDAPVDKKAWRAYRRALRDMMDGLTDVESVSWPVPPGKEN